MAAQGNRWLFRTMKPEVSRPVSKQLLEILACPQCRAPLVQAGGFLQCTNPACCLRYPIRDGIPILLVEEAIAATQDTSHKNTG